MRGRAAGARGGDAQRPRRRGPGGRAGGRRRRPGQRGARAAAARRPVPARPLAALDADRADRRGARARVPGRPAGAGRAAGFGRGGRGGDRPARPGGGVRPARSGAGGARALQAHGHLRGGLQHAARQRPAAAPLQRRRHPRERVRGNLGRRAGRHRRAPAQGAAVYGVDPAASRDQRRHRGARRLRGGRGPLRRGARSGRRGRRPGGAADAAVPVADPARGRAVGPAWLFGRRGRGRLPAGARGLRGQRRGRDALSDHPRPDRRHPAAGRPPDRLRPVVAVLPARRAVAARRVRHRCDEPALLHGALLPLARGSPATGSSAA